MTESRKKSVVIASQTVTLRDFVVFQLKLALDGVKDFVAINLSIIAIVIDLFAGRGRQPRRFYAVVRMSQRFDSWLRLHSMKGFRDAEERRDLEHNPDHETIRTPGDGEDRPLGADADTLVEKFEELARLRSERLGTRSPNTPGSRRDSDDRR